MLKEKRRTIIITSVIILLPMLIGLILWNRLPEELVTHWGADNEPNGYSSRAFTVFGMPLLMLALQWLCICAVMADPKGRNIAAAKLLPLVLWIIPAVQVAVFAAIYGFALGAELNVGFICCALMGVLYIVMGNYLPKTRQNYSIGIKIAWTLNDEGNWRATHRLAGWVWMIGGVIVLVCSPLANVFVLGAVTLALVIIPVVYSYIYYRRHK